MHLMQNNILHTILHIFLSFSWGGVALQVAWFGVLEERDIEIIFDINMNENLKVKILDVFEIITEAIYHPVV